MYPPPATVREAGEGDCSALYRQPGLGAEPAAQVLGQDHDSALPPSGNSRQLNVHLQLRGSGAPEPRWALRLGKSQVLHTRKAQAKGDTKNSSSPGETAVTEVLPRRKKQLWCLMAP